MKHLLPVFYSLLLILFQQELTAQAIDRETVVRRHNVHSAQFTPHSPAQVGNGKFAFGMDITGLQTFIPFNTLSDWSWHSFPLPTGMKPEDFEPVMLETYGKPLPYWLANPSQPVLSAWLEGNPHRFNLGRIGMILIKADGTEAQTADIEHASQTIDLWEGIVYSRFELEGKEVFVQTACHPDEDMIGVVIKSELIAGGRLKVFFDFPYPDNKGYMNFVGSYNHPLAHRSTLIPQSPHSAIIRRKMDDVHYQAVLSWDTSARLYRLTDTAHRFVLKPENSKELSFTCRFSPDEKTEKTQQSATNTLQASREGWKKYWQSGAAIDLSGSKDPRWKELERRIVLSQYVMRLNEAGLYPPQEAGLVNNGWYGRFHFEMIWWHGVHYGLWNRPELFDRYLSVYRDFFKEAKKRAQTEGRGGVRWPKCTGNFNREWPCLEHGLLIWQQPHPIYFAEMEYRTRKNRQTIEKWKEIVFQTAEYMADYAHYDSIGDRYVLGPPLVVVSENTTPWISKNPAFELGYWRYGLRTALAWQRRLGLPEKRKWKEVLEKLSPLPQQEGVYITYEGIENMWTKYNWGHPALIGTFGMLPGDGVHPETFRKTLEKIETTWDFKRVWGWDFPMMAMAAARCGQPKLAIDYLLYKSPQFQFDIHGLATGGPYPYFPSNGGLLAAVAMMCGGWDGSKEEYPGFPKDGSWTVRAEGFVPMQ